jgi:hypothetical protein
VRVFLFYLGVFDIEMSFPIACSLDIRSLDPNDPNEQPVPFHGGSSFSMNDSSKQNESVPDPRTAAAAAAAAEDAANVCPSSTLCQTPHEFLLGSFPIPGDIRDRTPRKSVDHFVHGTYSFDCSSVPTGLPSPGFHPGVPHMPYSAFVPGAPVHSTSSQPDEEVQKKKKKKKKNKENKEKEKKNDKKKRDEYAEIEQGENYLNRGISNKAKEAEKKTANKRPKKRDNEYTAKQKEEEMKRASEDKSMCKKAKIAARDDDDEMKEKNKKSEKCRPDSPDDGTGRFSYVTNTDKATHLYVVKWHGMDTGAYSVHVTGKPVPDQTTTMLDIKLFFMPRNHSGRAPVYPCITCGAKFEHPPASKYACHPCKLTEEQPVAGGGSPRQFFGHMCQCCYGRAKKGYYCALVDNIVVFVPLTDTMLSKWDESCRRSNRRGVTVPNFLFDSEAHHQDWFVLNSAGQLVYNGRWKLYPGTKMLCMHGPRAHVVSKQYKSAFPMLSYAPTCIGDIVLLPSAASLDMSSFAIHRFSKHDLTPHGPFPNAKVTTYGVLVAETEINTGDIISYDHGFEKLWKIVHRTPMPAFDMSDLTFRLMAEQVAAIFPNDVTKLTPAQFLKYMSVYIDAEKWKDMECLMPQGAVSLHVLVADAKAILSDEQYNTMMRLLPAGFD